MQCQKVQNNFSEKD